MRLSLVALLLSACAEEAGTCGDAEDLAEGAVAAQVDGAAWEAAGTTWLWQGTRLQVNTEAGGGWRISMLLESAADGTALSDAVDAGLPVDVTLGDGAGGWALVYPDAGDSYSTDAADGGTVTLTDVGDAGTRACFSFTAAQDGGESVSFTDGAFSAVAWER